jgi:hypothetical protein
MTTTDLTKTAITTRGAMALYYGAVLAAVIQSLSFVTGPWQPDLATPTTLAQATPQEIDRELQFLLAEEAPRLVDAVVVR